jgi:glutathione-regulated potassium-efflux system ancillary protein KefC
MNTRAGQNVLSVALFQDIAAIPILAIIPLLAVASATGAEPGGGWLAAAKAFGVIGLIVFGGRLLLRPALRWIARSRTPELFTAAALLLVVATASLMQSVGLSMALGAFLAGVLLAESEYRRELETDLEPFKGLLLGLFFIAVGMSIDFAVVLAQPLLVAALVAVFLLVKALVLWGMVRHLPMPLAEKPVFVILLAQGGEFGFVVFQTALGAKVIKPEAASLLLAAVAGGLWVSHSGSATDREDQERAAVRTKNLADLQAADQTALTTYGWSDKAKGIIRIPVTRAMELVMPELNARSTKGSSSQTQQ